jgi:hypothetical protein
MAQIGFWWGFIFVSLIWVLIWTGTLERDARAVRAWIQARAKKVRNGHK